MKINSISVYQNKQSQGILTFNARYKGIKIVQDVEHINDYPHILKEQCTQALRLLRQAKGLIKKEMREVVEQKIPEDIPIQFEVHRSERGMTFLSMKIGPEGQNDLLWSQSIRPEKGYDSFNEFYFQSNGNPKSDGFYIEKSPNINKGNKGRIVYEPLTDADPKSIAKFLKEQFLSAVNIHNAMPSSYN